MILVDDGNCGAVHVVIQSGGHGVDRQAECMDDQEYENWIGGKAAQFFHAQPQDVT